MGYGHNLTKMESRPAGGSLGKYIFSIDFTGHILEPAVAGVVELLRKTLT